MTKVRVFDIEANGLTPDTIHCMVFSSLDKKEVNKFEPHQMAEATAFLDTVDVLIGHNILTYDLPAIKKVLGYEYKGKKVDTLIMSRLQQPNRQPPPNARGDAKAMRSPHGLGCWGYRVGRGKPEHEDWDNYSPEMLHRCTEDVMINVDVYHALMAEGKGQTWKPAHMMTFKLFENLQKQEEAGWLLDIPYIKKSITLLNYWIERIDRIITPHLPLTMDILEAKKAGEYGWVKKPFMKSGKYSASVEKHYEDVLVFNPRLVGGPFSRICFRPIDLGSSAEVKDWMLSQGWEPAEWNLDDDGNRRSPKMPKDGEFPGVESKIGKLYVKRAKSVHRRSNMQGWLDRVRPDGRLPSVVSGLADTRRAKHANIANVPNAEAFFGKQMRRGFIARDGWVLVSADAASCQDRFMCERANDDGFTKMLLEGKKEDGTDSHTLAQFAINKVTEVFRLHAISRGKAKNFNFGWTFGASDNKLGKMIGGTKDAGAAIRAALGEVFPAKAALIEKMTKEWRKNAKKRVNRWGNTEHYDGWITGLDGAPIYIKSEHAVLVYAVQADEAIYMTAVYNWIHQFLAEKYKWGEDYVVVCFYHDEVTVECREGISKDVAKIMERAFATASKYFKLRVPQVGEACIGKNWLEVH